ncbi:hypothetical protein P3X46_014108 [Hevea brasiliensis]|uniref:RNase H type-1 domain-containing protein n=1 Tax=Hevea brasiliensis TaxID=3981 RepID=A0ABQ9M5K7_HEVBR|nr:hypothetical protein P3X46_014108 [Hevea brasiliensis]
MLAQIRADGGEVNILQVPRKKNQEADSLVKAIVAGEQHFSQPIPIEEITTSTVDREEETFPIDIGETWMTPIFCYLNQGILLEDQLEAKKIIQRSVRYSILNGWLYRRSYLQPWLKCISREDDLLVLLEIHEGLSSTHEEARMISKKAFRQGFF